MTKRIMVVLGTRPDAIKLVPVIGALRARPHIFETIVCSTDQHREMLDQVLETFALVPDIRLGVMQPEQSLPDLTAVLIARLSNTLASVKPQRIIVQGDTTSAFVAALAGYYQKTPVAHVEAGLRSHERYSPFPEEINRRLISTIADVHFAPTPDAADALIGEGVPRSAIHVTGNTVVDALNLCLERIQTTTAISSLISPPVRSLAGAGAPLIIVSCHRRESFGADLAAICQAVAALAAKQPAHQFVFPVHLNPKVRNQVFSSLGGIPNVALIEPVSYPEMIFLLARAVLVLSDSGGLQEETPSFNAPLLILRRNTERPAGVTAGRSFLVGTDETTIVDQATKLLAGPRNHDRAPRNPYGDGSAALRIAEILAGPR